MHTGEEWFSIGWPQYAVFAVFLALWVFLLLRDKLPGMASFKNFLDAINSAGGHIFILLLLSSWSIKISMQFFYHLLSLSQETMSKDQAIVTAGVTYVTGTLTGAFVGALLKTMSGGKANSTPGPDTLTATLTPEPPAKTS